MMDKFDKCRFCCHYDDFDGCTNEFCARYSHEFYEPNKTRILEKAKELGISVVDLIALINLG